MPLTTIRTILTVQSIKKTNFEIMYMVSRGCKKVFPRAFES